MVDRLWCNGIIVLNFLKREDVFKIYNIPRNENVFIVDIIKN